MGGPAKVATPAAGLDVRQFISLVGTAYAAAALEKAAHNVAAAANGTRNNTLNKEAYGMAGFIANGELDAQQVITELAVAARAAGLEDAEIEKTLRSGLNSGVQKPRTTTEPPAAVITTATAHADADMTVVEDWSLASSAGPALALPSGPDSWRVYTLQDARLPRPPIEWVVHGVVEAGGLYIWYGAPGDLKSFLLQDLAVCIAGNHRWLQNSVTMLSGLDISGGPAIWIDADMGERRTADRFRALAAAYKLPNDAPLRYLSMPDPQPDLGNAQHVNALAALAQKHAAKVLFFDNLGVMIGKADENSAEVQRPMAGFRKLTEDTGAAVIVIHHQRKTTTSAGGRLGDALRGHSSIEAKLDGALLVRREGNNVNVFPTKIRGAEIKPFGALFTYSHDEHLQLSAARFWSADMVDARAQALEIMWQKVVGALERGPLSTTALRDEIHANKNVLVDLLSARLKAGQVVRTGGKNGAKMWSLPDV